MADGKLPVGPAIGAIEETVRKWIERHPGDLVFRHPAALALAAGVLGFVVARLIGAPRGDRRHRAFTRPASTAPSTTWPSTTRPSTTWPQPDYSARASGDSLKRHGDKFGRVFRSPDGAAPNDRAPTYPEG